MPHRRFWVAASTLFLFASAAMTTGQAQTGRNPGAAQGQIPPQILQRFDANGNGQLEPAEQQAAAQYMQQMQAGGGQPGAGKGMGGRGAAGQGMGGQGLGGQGGGMMNPQMQQQLMQKFDTNGNGQLEPAEQQAAAQYVQQMMQTQGGGQGMGGRPGGGKGMGGRPGAGGMGPGGMAGAMTNPQMQQQLMQKFDKNGNGQLDPDEQQAAAQFMQQGMGGQGKGGRPGGGKGMGGQPGAGGPGAGGPAGAMMNPQVQQQLLQKFDKNKNGQLDPSEQQAAAQYVQQMQAGGGRPNKNN